MSNESEPLRECFIAVPTKSDWGKPNADRGTWLTACDSADEAESFAVVFRNHDIPRTVLRFQEVIPIHEQKADNSGVLKAQDIVGHLNMILCSYSKGIPIKMRHQICDKLFACLTQSNGGRA